MYTVETVAARYGVTEMTVLGWIARGELKAINVGRAPGKKRPRWRISQAALDAFEAARTPTPPAPSTRRRRAGAGEVVEFYS
jgi:excisionase family DNA binding protein